MSVERTDMHERVHQPAPQSPDRPDTVFALVAGLYAALLLSPAVVFAAAVAYPLGAGALYIALLAVLTAITTAGTVAVGRVRGVVERIGASRVARGLAVLPVLGMVGYGVAAASVDAPGTDGVVAAGIVLSGVGIATGMALVAMSRTRYARAVVEDESVRAEWKAGWPQPRRMRIQIGAVTLYLAGAALLFGGEFVGLGAYEWIGALAFVPGGAGLGWGQPRAYRLAPAGIERSNYVHRRLYEWDGFASVSVSEDAVVLHRESWWRPAFRCWREEIDDPDALIDALDDHLPRA